MLSMIYIHQSCNAQSYTQCTACQRGTLLIGHNKSFITIVTDDSWIGKLDIGQDLLAFTAQDTADGKGYVQNTDLIDVMTNFRTVTLSFRLSRTIDYDYLIFKVKEKSNTIVKQYRADRTEHIMQCHPGIIIN